MGTSVVKEMQSEASKQQYHTPPEWLPEALTKPKVGHSEEQLELLGTMSEDGN